MAGRRRGSQKRDQPAAERPSIRPKWLWWRSRPEGRSRAREEFESLPTSAQAGLSVKIGRFLDGTSRDREVDHLGDGIYEIRHRVGNNPYRVLFTGWGSDYVALTAFYKNQRKTSKQDLDRAKKRAVDWVDMFGESPPGQ